ncbi:MAG: hypothetical protein OXT06_01305, partial [Rhodospirillaceae bacterium]|nr:hypothetical protein [Rhodospirillaceae bacterium]MDD9925796.1 hypothetical protein [Rhodospirillaceae bacterium]
MSADQANTLSEIVLLSELSGDALATLEKRCSWRNFAPQEQIIDRQSNTRDVYFIVTGRVLRWSRKIGQLIKVYSTGNG